jgi:flagellar hook assembly protein FlgD
VQNDYVANVQIFDAMGRMTKRLLENELLGLEGTFKWDGSTDNGDKARIGIYILWIEIFQPNGGKVLEKKTVVVGGEF